LVQSFIFTWNCRCWDSMKHYCDHVATSLSLSCYYLRVYAVQLDCTVQQ
jgi:hypothetical protein